MTPTNPLQFKDGPSYREQYANSVQVRMTTWDVSLIFGIMRGDPPQMEIENLERIIMSPQQAKALANVLTQNIQSYESAFGEIKIAAPVQVGGVIQ